MHLLLEAHRLTISAPSDLQKKDKHRSSIKHSHKIGMLWENRYTNRRSSTSYRFEFTWVYQNGKTIASLAGGYRYTWNSSLRRTWPPKSPSRDVFQRV
jgi:hypothetical protein